MRPGKIIAAVFGRPIALAAIGLVFGGTLPRVGVRYRSAYADGFLTSPTYDLTMSWYALTSGNVDLASRPGDWWPSNVGTVKFDVARTDGGPVFVGIGPAADVDRYLDGVGIDEITRLGTGSTDVSYQEWTVRRLHLRPTRPSGPSRPAAQGSNRWSGTWSRANGRSS